MMEVGVARPKAQGQAMIRTATKFSIAKRSAGLGPKIHHARNVSTATPMTVGTKILAT